MLVLVIGLLSCVMGVPNRDSAIVCGYHPGGNRALMYGCEKHVAHHFPGRKHALILELPPSASTDRVVGVDRCPRHWPNHIPLPESSRETNPRREAVGHHSVSRRERFREKHTCPRYSEVFGFLATHGDVSFREAWSRLYRHEAHPSDSSQILGMVLVTSYFAGKSSPSEILATSNIGNVCSVYRNEIASSIVSRHFEQWPLRPRAVTDTSPSRLRAKHTPWVSLPLVCPSLVSSSSVWSIVMSHRVQQLWYELQIKGGEVAAAQRVVHVDRRNLLETSMQAIAQLSPRDLSRGFIIHFANERGVDVGGVFTNWFSLVNKELWRSRWFVTEENGVTMINSKALKELNRTGERVKQMYFFAGKMVGLGLADGRPIGVKLGVGIIKYLVGSSVQFADLEKDDPEMFSTLSRLISSKNFDAEFGDQFDFDVTDVIGNRVDLKTNNPSRQAYPVSSRNVREFVDARAKWRLVGSVHPLLAAMQKGFDAVVPPRVWSDGFSPSISTIQTTLLGTSRWSANDFLRHVQWEHGYSSEFIRWFDEIVNGMSRKDLDLLLSFVTGSSILPLEGFRALKSRIVITLPIGHWTDAHYPTSSTCVLHMYLPRYRSKSTLASRLLEAIRNSDTFARA